MRSPWSFTVYAALTGIGIGFLVGVRLTKEVTLDIDGGYVTLRSFATTVDGVLDVARVVHSVRDHVAPAPGTSLKDGSTIVVRHARPLTLTVDGKKSTHLTTALNVGEALEDLKLNRPVSLSVSRKRQIPVSGFSLNVKTKRRVVVVAGKVRLDAYTTGRTVREALKQAKITLSKGDRVRPSLNAFPKDGTVIRVVPALPEAPPHTIPIAANVAALNWAGLADCESHGNPKAVGGGGAYYGMYQFGLSMWQTVGGTKTPIDWPAEEQTYRAQLLYQRVQGRWQGQWPHCGARLFG